MAWVFGEEDKEHRGQGRRGWVFGEDNSNVTAFGDTRSLEERIRDRQREGERLRRQQAEYRASQEENERREAAAAAAESEVIGLPIAASQPRTGNAQAAAPARGGSPNTLMPEKTQPAVSPKEQKARFLLGELTQPQSGYYGTSAAQIAAHAGEAAAYRQNVMGMDSDQHHPTTFSEANTAQQKPVKPNPRDALPEGFGFYETETDRNAFLRSDYDQIDEATVERGRRMFAERMGVQATGRSAWKSRETGAGMSTAEQRQFYYLLGSGDEKGAMQYLKNYRKFAQDADSRDYVSRALTQTEDDGALKSAGKRLSAGAMNLLDAPARMLYGAQVIGQNVKNAITGENEAVSQYSAGANAMRFGEMTAGKVTEGMSGPGAFLAGTGLSIANNLVNYLVYGAAAPFMMAAEAGAQSAWDAGQNGGSAGQQLAMGLLGGGAEYLGEKVSFKGLENIAENAALRSGLKNFVKSVLAQSATEFTEESATEVMNIISELAVMRSQSEAARYYQEYLKENPDKAEAMALAATVLNQAGRVLQAGAAGAISGGVMAGAATARGRYQAYQLGGQMQPYAAEMIQQGMESAPDTDSRRLAGELSQKLENGQAPTKLELGALQIANEQAIAAEQQQPVPLPIAGQQSENQQNGPVEVGQNTTIQHPYEGKTPQTRANAQYEPVSVQDGALTAAQNRIEQARQETGGEKIKSSLKRIYREAVGSLFGGRAVTVENVEFQGWPYDVTLNTNVIDKVISDKNLSAEKLAVFEVIDAVVKNAEYVGSGQYIPHGSHIKDVTRYDYFETQAVIGGNPYTVSFDVEVYPSTNNYRTHRVIENIEIVRGGDTKKEQGKQTLSAVRTAYSAADTGPAPAATERFSSPVTDISIPQSGEIATEGKVPLPLGEQGTAGAPAGLPVAPETGTQVSLGQPVPLLIADRAKEAVKQQAIEAGTATAAELEHTERMVQRSGRRLEYIYEPGSPVGGVVDGERVTINLAHPDHAFSTAVHEVGHTMRTQNEKAWANFETAMLRLADSDSEMGALARGVVDAYLAEDSKAFAGMQNRDGSLNEAALTEEVSLKLAEEIVKDPERITKAVEQDRGLIRQLLDFVRGVKNQVMVKLTGSQAAALDEAERTLVNLLRGEAGSVDGERYSYVGENANLSREKRDALWEAKRQELLGADSEKIRQEYGWFRGADGKWRTEIDDSGMKYRGPEGGTLEEILDHPALFEAYPELRGVKVTFEEMRDGINGRHDGEKHSIALNSRLHSVQQESTLLHEIQHEVQQLAGFTEGGSVKKSGVLGAFVDAYEQVKNLPAYEKLRTPDERLEFVKDYIISQSPDGTFRKAARTRYKQISGEVEATDVKKRRDYTPDQRKQVAPNTSGDPKRKTQIVADFIDMLKRMEYPEEQINAFVKEESNNDSSGKTDGIYGEIPERGLYRRGGDVYSERSKADGGTVQGLSGRDGGTDGNRRGGESVSREGKLSDDVFSLQAPPNTESALPWLEYARQRYAGTMEGRTAAQRGLDVGQALPLPTGRQEEHGEAQAMRETLTRAMLGESIEEQTAKSRRYQAQAENKFVKAVGDSLSTPGGARRDYLKPAVQELTRELRQTGKVSAETAGRVFAETYEQGRVVLDEFYEAYKDLKKELRTEPVTLAQQDRDSKTYQEFWQKNLGALRLVNEGGTPVDVRYQELSERWPEMFPAEITNPADQLERMAEASRSITRTEMDLDTYNAGDPFWRDAARESFDRALDELRQDMGLVTRYDAEQSRRKTAAQAPEPPTTEQMQAIYRAARQLSRKAEKAVASSLLTDADSAAVESLLKGKLQPEQVSGPNKAAILQVYEAKKAVADTLGPVQAYRNQRKAAMRATAAGLLENSVKWKDKLAGLQYSTETMERNLRDVAGADADAVIAQYFTPVHKHEAEATRWKNQLREQVRALKLTRAESEYLQLYGELKGVEAAREMGLKRSDSELESLRVQEQKYYQEHKDKISRTKVEKALKVFRRLYDTTFDQMNQAYVRNGYAPVEYRQGYFPHFTEAAPDGVLSRIANRLGISAGNDTLPTDIAGLTYTFKPGRKWNPFAQQRGGFETVYDAVKGFDKYIEVAADVIYHTDDIQQLRAFEAEIREQYSDAGVKEQIRRIEEMENLTDAQKETLLAEIKQNSRGHLSKLAQQLTEYTNLLAGKKSLHDRTVEADTGRAVYQVMNSLENKVAANMVAVNPGSWLTNFIPITQASAECSAGSLVRAAKETAKSWFRDDGFVNESAFLTNRAGSDPLSKTWSQKWSARASKPMEWIDSFTASVVTRAKYYDNIKAGMTQDLALDNADAFAAGIMADRSKGALPTYFSRKNPLTRIFTMYQVEVNNQLRYLFKDLPRAKQDEALGALAWALLKYFIGAYLYNDIYEHFIGRRPALDVIGIANEAVGDLTGYQMPNVVEAGGELLAGRTPDFTAEKKGAAQAITRLGENVAEELPFVGGLLGGGRVPISSAVPDIAKMATAGAGLISGDTAPNKALDTLGREAAKPLFYLLPPFGGGQLKKGIEGVSTVARGGSYGMNNAGESVLRFPVEDQSIGTYLQAGIFGPYALPTGQEYAAGGFKTKSVNWTAEYEEARALGVSYEAFSGWKAEAAEVRADKNEKGNPIAGSKAEKLRRLLNKPEFGFTPRQREFLMRQAGYDYYTLKTIKEEEKSSGE